MREKYHELLSKIQDARKSDETTVSQMVKEYQDSIDAYEELTNYFEESICAFIYNKWEILFNCLLYSYDFEPSKLEKRERRNLTLGMFFMVLFELEAKESERQNIPYEIEINDLDDLDDFVQNRLQDAYYIMEGILYYKGQVSPEEFIDSYTYMGIQKKASCYFGFYDNIKRRKK